MIPGLPVVRRFALVMGVVLGTVISGPAPSLAQSTGLAGPYLAAEHAARRGDIQAAARYFIEALAADPDNPALVQQALLHQMAAGKIEGSVALARRLEELSPGHHLGLLLIAAHDLKSDQYAEVRKLLDSANLDNGPYVGRLMDAWAAFGDGDVETARKTLEDLEEAGTGGPAGKMVAAYHLGLLAAATGDDNAAIEHFDRSVEVSGGSISNRLSRIKAGSLARTGKVDEAIALIDERLSRSFGDKRLEALRVELTEGRLPAPEVTTAAQGAAESLFGVALFLSRGNNRIIGLAYSRLAVYLDPDLTEAKLAIAELLDNDGQYELAIAAYEAVPRNAPEAFSALIGRAQALAADDRVEAAIVAMREIVARYPRTIEAHTALGDMLRREERYADAAEAYDGAIALIGEPETRHWVLFYQRGITLERSHQWDRAEADFKKALELQPEQPLVLNYLGYSWIEMGRNFDEARKMIERAVEQRPDDGYIVDSLGWVLYRLGKFEGAVKHLERAVELRPVDAVINDHFGDALWKVGRTIEARFQWKRALSFKPDENEAERIRKKLEIGLDRVLAEEDAVGAPALVGGSEAAPVPSDGG